MALVTTRVSRVLRAIPSQILTTENVGSNCVCIRNERSPFCFPKAISIQSFTVQICPFEDVQL